MKIIQLIVMILLSSTVLGVFQATSDYALIPMCTGQSFTDVLYVTNTGSTAENIYIQTDKDWVNTNPAQFSLQPGYRQSIVQVMTPPAGIHELETRIIGSDVKVLRQTINVQDCLTSFSADEASYSNCQCKPTVYTFNLRNNDDDMKTYDMSINLTTGYYELSEETITLQPGESRKGYIVITLPCDDFGGIYRLSADEDNFIDLELQVRDCYSYAAGIEYMLEACNGSNIIKYTIDNDGFANNFSVSFNNMTEVFSLGAGKSKSGNFTLQLQEGLFNESMIVIPSIGKQSVLDVRMEVGACKEINWLKILAIVAAVFLVLVLLLVLYIFLTTRMFLWVLFGIVCLVLLIILWQPVWHFLLLYRYYFLGGLLLAALIIIYFWSIKHEESNIKWFLVIIGIVVIFLLFATCFFTGVCSNMGLPSKIDGNQSLINESDILEEGPTVYIWNKNSKKHIDLSEYISDKDDDNLSIVATQVENITIEIDGFDVTLTPAQDWHGQAIINFIVDDGRGGRVVSPDIDLVVLEEEYSPMDPVYNFISRYINFILAILLFIVIIVILLILKTSFPKKEKRIIVRRKK